MKKVTVVFPMAGEGQRFGGQFKPFIEFEGKTFIKHAIEPFLKWSDQIDKFHFILRSDHNREHTADVKLLQLTNANPISLAMINKTDNVCETIIAGCKDLKGPVMFVDCDNSVNVDPIFEFLKSNPQRDVPDCIIPTWSLIGEDPRNWSIATILPNGSVTSIAEKKYPKGNGIFEGVIGCYYFKKYMPEFFEQNIGNGYISHVIRDYIYEERPVLGIRIQEARFFGDPERLRATIGDKYKGTIFIDFDGTIVKHEVEHTGKVKVLPGARKQLNKWYDQGYYIVITTGRPNNSPNLHAILRKIDIPYHYILFNLPSGPRYLINDRKPWDLVGPMAQGFDIERNAGISDINITEPAPRVIQRLSGASYAETFLMADFTGKEFIRKVVPISKPIAVGKLKTQFERMKSWDKLSPGIVPKVYGSGENTSEYYYDMEYLPDHEQMKVYSGPGEHPVYGELFKALGTIYNATKVEAASPEYLLSHHISEKVELRIAEIQGHVPPADIKEYKDILKNILKHRIKYLKFLPKYVCSIHGDLTYENILFNPRAEPGHKIKFIDLHDTGINDIPELDLAKLFQSEHSKYEAWSKYSSPIHPPIERNTDQCAHLVAYWKDYFDKTYINQRAYLYLSFHLIRMIPYRLAQSQAQADYALKEALFYIKLALEL